MRTNGALQVAQPLAVAFPSADSQESAMTPTPSPQRRQHLLSFRRISLLSSSPLGNRHSTVSIASSYQSTPDSPGGTSTESLNAHVGVKASSGAASGSPGGVKGPTKGGARGNGRPTSVEVGKKVVRRKEPLLVDDAKEAKRRKVIVELYETERAYVDGLDLIYAVSDRRGSYQ